MQLEDYVNMKAFSYTLIKPLNGEVGERRDNKEKLVEPITGGPGRAQTGKSKQIWEELISKDFIPTLEHHSLSVLKSMCEPYLFPKLSSPWPSE